MGDSGSIMVTGSRGLIGRQVVTQLASWGRQVVAADLGGDPPLFSELGDQVIERACDVTDYSSVYRLVKELGVVRIVHLAGMLAPNSSADPARAVVVNCVGTANIMQVSLELGVVRVVWASTTAVFGDANFYDDIVGRNLISDSDVPNPKNIYSGSKYLNEIISLEFRRRGLDVLGIRPAMTFGHPEQSGAVGSLHRAFRDAILSGDGVVTQPWLASTRVNPISAADMGVIFAKAVLHPRALSLPIYNAGTGDYVTVNDLAMMATKSGRLGCVRYENEGSGVLEPFDFPDVDSSRLRFELAWEPEYTLRESVERWVAPFVVERGMLD
ncbi:MAG: NAD(P)-dependent oxidoreductase [Alcaligenaceae bacterium]|nr:MAG: NAD(P)-dependent oxidoreductase [Alcaligenaceae bacterium]